MVIYLIISFSYLKLIICSYMFQMLIRETVFQCNGFLFPQRKATKYKRHLLFSEGNILNGRGVTE